ncbi:hypothetical protein BESB_062620 [Besnoitia besnoiti]|uniref:Uncharacterized protein n=1 Tax=Besnoitia besnoiti TaxID=94643 RepID=A0A2A9MBM8_BESBE|nr:hypothetical protein BESB_062620 [Besnoitia besnoiti]PFH35375.1 hypothetical protein BESB_062620 [Besnoitia besnoiti]
MDAIVAEASAALPDVPTIARAALAAGQAPGAQNPPQHGPSAGVRGQDEDDEDVALARQIRKAGVSTPRVQEKLFTIEGKDVAVICVTFSDKFFITISDNGKMAAMIQGSAGFEEQRADFGVRFIFGDRHREYFLVYARELLAIISARTKKELLLAISVSVDRPSFFRAVMDGIRANFQFV